MFDDLKKLKDKAKTGSEGLGFPDTEYLDIDKIAEDSKTSLDEGIDQASDTLRRSAGKVKGQFTPPKSETKRSFMKEETWFFCSDCVAKLGPMEAKKWKNLLKALLGGGATVAGVVMLNPVLIFKGSTSLASMKKDDRGMIDKLRGDSKLNEKAKNYLMQCEYCGEWVCSSCFDAERLVCKKCGSGE